MTSILTNTGAMVALQTLQSINSNLGNIQSEISTGKSISSAKDNSAIWAISKVMESDVAGFTAISDSLSLGESTVAVASEAAETVTDLLTQMKEKIVAAQEENVDRSKIQTDISALRDQISSVVGAAQFNGLNMLSGTEDVSVLSSLDRSSDGSVTASQITVARQDLSTSTGTFGTGTDLSLNSTASDTTVSATGNTAVITLATEADISTNGYSMSVGGTTVSFAAGDLTGDQDDAASFITGAINALGLEGITASVVADEITITSTRAFESVDVSATKDGAGIAFDSAETEIGERAETIAFSASASVNEGDGYKAIVGGTTYSYVAGKGESFDDVANGLKAAVDAGGIEGVTTRVGTNDAGEAVLKIDTTGSDLTLSESGAAGGEASGGLFGLGGIDVTTDSGAEAALANIEVLINASVDAAASFGSAQGRIETQNEFIGKLTDSLKAGIGSMVDANMEEASARLQALQVQQQLGIQALSIANQAPQSVLSLFQ